MVAPLVIGGIAAAVIGAGGGIWYLWRRARSGRIGLELEEVKEDKELLGIDEKILKIETDEKHEAKKLYKLFLKVHKRANTLGFNVNNRLIYLNRIIQGLNIIKGEKINATQEARLMEQTNNYINFYLNNFPLQDRKIAKWVSEIRAIQVRLYGGIKEEIAELSEKEQLLDKERRETEMERAA